VQKLKKDLTSKGITALPTSVDWSSKEPPVGDQGAQGSCTAWATGYYYKTFQEGKEQSWSLTSIDHQFSPAFIYNQIMVGHDWGSSIPDALQLLVDKGCDTLAVFPYNQYDYTTQPTSEQLQLCIPFKAQSYARIFQGQGSCTDDTINILKSWLANGDTFVIAIPVYSEFDNATSDPSYVVPPHNPMMNHEVGMHCRSLDIMIIYIIMMGQIIMVRLRLLILGVQAMVTVVMLT